MFNEENTVEQMVQWCLAVSHLGVARGQFLVSLDKNSLSI